MTTPETDHDAELRQRIAYALSNAGAYCGDCNFEPGDRGKCQHCEQHWTWCADKLLPLVAAERADAVREELLLNEVALRSASDSATSFVAAGSYAAAANLLRARAAAIRPQEATDGR